MDGNIERVVVTGMGVVSPLGLDVESFWQALLAGKSGVVELEGERFENVRPHIGAIVQDLDERDFFDRKEMRRLSRSSRLAVVAASQAVGQAGLQEGGIELGEVAVMVGSSIGGYSSSDPYFRDFYEKGRVSPFSIPVSMNSAPSANISIRFGFRGPLVNIDAACATSAHSIGLASHLIRNGMLEVAVCGGADDPFSIGVVAAWNAMKALSQREDNPMEACRPFSADRDGLVLGEGAGVLVLESESHARLHGKTILGEISGYGATSDSFHLTQPSKDGPVRAMQRALKDAGLGPGEIDSINAHATGTIWNDKIETAAIKDVFGARAYDIPVVGNKAALGHSIGASGALEMIACLLSLRDQILPPTINYKVPDPDCDLDYVVTGNRPYVNHHILSNSFAFGGSNAALVASLYEPAGSAGHPF